MPFSSPSPGWTDARVETLATLWRSGLSASQIAKALGGVTRNAVIGKVHRLGLAGRPQPSTPRSARPRRQPSWPSGARSRTRLSPPLPAGGREPYVPDDPGQVRELEALTAHACRWPIGDPRAADFSFCGRASGGPGPYCPDHARRAYRAGAEPLDRDPVLRRLLAGPAW